MHPTTGNSKRSNTAKQTVQRDTTRSALGQHSKTNLAVYYKKLSDKKLVALLAG
jgi:hypothetical protein